MALKRVQRVRHTTANADLFVGLQGEITHVTDTNEIRSHDGTTAGGHKVLTKTQNDALYQPLAGALTAFVNLGNATGIIAQVGSAQFVMRSMQAPLKGFTITNPDGVAGNPIFALADDLAAVEGLSTNGIAVRTADATWATRSISVTGSGITITNADGVAGNPTLGVAGDLGALAGFATGTTGIPARTADDTWSLRNLIPPAAGMTITNPAGVAGNPTFAFANDLGALEALAGTGFAYRSGVDTWEIAAPSSNIIGGATIDLSNTGVIAGSYPFANVTVDVKGRVTGISSSQTLNVINKSADYAIQTIDLGHIINATADVAFTLPASPGSGGSNLTLKSTTEKKVTFVASGTDTVDGFATATIWQIASYDTWVLVPITGGWIIIQKGAHNVGDLIPSSGAVVPHGFIAADGSAISRANFNGLFNVNNTTYGAGDGSTTFNVIDLGGRVIAGKESVATRLTAAKSGITGSTLGSAGGAETHLLTGPESGIQAHNHTASFSGSGSASGSSITYHTGAAGGSPNVPQLDQAAISTNQQITSTLPLNNPSISVSGSVTVNNSASINATNEHQNTQPTIVANYWIKT